MRAAIVSFLVGVCWLQWQPTLPSVSIIAFAAVAGIVLLVWRAQIFRARQAVLLLGAALVGFAWAGWRAQVRLAEMLPGANEGRDIQVVGVVSSLPRAFERGVRFEFDVEDASAQVPDHIALSWYRLPVEEDDGAGTVLPLQAGERWRLTVRLKRPHGNVNPHGFDYEGWLFERDVRATGYVRKSVENSRLNDSARGVGYSVDRLRQRVRDHFKAVLGDTPAEGVLVALAVGDQQSISAAWWRTFARTGVTHLLSVSGLHITMLAGLAAWMAGWGWRRVPWLMLRCPTQKAMAVVGLAVAGGYAVFSGYAVPAQRTFYMLAVVAVALWTGRQVAGSKVLALALLLVLLIDPWAVLAPGFWLSFGAVAILFYSSAHRLAEESRWRTWLRSQWAVTIGMLPVLLALFQQFSLVSPLANAVAIPLVSLVITPLALLAMVPIFQPVLLLAHGLTRWLLDVLQWLADSDWAVWQQPAPPGWATGLALIGAVWLLLPRGFPSRWLGAVAMLPLVFVPIDRPALGDMRVRVLDVGQGLSVHVQTAEHDLIYDAGPAYSEDSDAGARIIFPYLRAAGVRRLDALLISHQDKDHEGGAMALLASLPIVEVISSLPEEHPVVTSAAAHRRCADGQTWEWDGVRFEILHPQATGYSDQATSNVLSCVLKVSSPGASVLLTGDIDARSEVELVERHGARLAADVLVPAHHGSRSSSSDGFVSAVSPRLTFFSAGYRNRFGHPTPEVLSRFAETGTTMFRTDRDGALTVDVRGHSVSWHTERQLYRRYWLDG